MTVEPRAVDLHCFDANPEPDPDPDPDPGGGGQQKMCIPPGKILGTPLFTAFRINGPFSSVNSFL